MDKGTREDNLRSREMFEKAIELDPGYAKAIGKNTWTYLLEYYNGWTESPEEALARATNVAHEALRADPNEPWAYYGVASACLLQKKHDCAVRAFEKAHELNPNDATLLVEYGWALALSGRPEEGIPLMHDAIRLNPFTPEFYWQDLAEGYFVAGQDEEALSAIEKIAQPWPVIYRVRAAIYALAGRFEDAHAAATKYLELEPQMTLDRAAETMPFSRQEDYDRFHDALRKAGLPEKAPAPGT